MVDGDIIGLDAGVTTSPALPPPGDEFNAASTARSIRKCQQAKNFMKIPFVAAGGLDSPVEQISAYKTF